MQCITPKITMLELAQMPVAQQLMYCRAYGITPIHIGSGGMVFFKDKKRGFGKPKAH